MSAKKVAVVGCGAWGKNLIRNYQEIGALAAVCDVNEEKAREIAQTFDTTALSFASILADESIDGIVIASSAASHYTLAKQVLEAGKYVFIEKPLTIEISEAEALADLAKARNLEIMVGHLLHYHGAFAKLKALVAEGALGQIQFLSASRLNIGRIRTEEDVIWSLSPHDISMMLALVAETPYSVETQSTQILHDGVADTASVTLKFPGGTLGLITASWLHPFKEQKLVVVGEKAMAVFDDLEPWPTKLAIYRHTVEWRDGAPIAIKADAEHVPLEPQEPLREECLHFLNCIENRTKPLTDASEGLNVLRVLAEATKTKSDTQSEDKTMRVQGDHPGVKIHETAYVDAPCQIGEDTRIWHFSHIMPEVTVGKNCSIGQNVVIGPNVSVGDNCKIQNNVSLYEGVRLEDNVFCGPSCVFTNVINPRAEIERKTEFLETRVKSGATIGANATIICGSTLGEFCFIAAGATVTRDVPNYALMAGVPAKRIGWMTRAGMRLGEDLVCPYDGTRYRETANGNLEVAIE
jgi:predicted dehydrogenase/acetyltransferase-like isoleucine patch superfamily enzyme